MANEKVQINKPGDAKVVKTYRIDPDTFEAAEAACKQQHGVGIATFIEPLLKAHFKLDKDKKK